MELWGYFLQFLVVGGVLGWWVWKRRQEPGWKPSFLREQEAPAKPVQVLKDAPAHKDRVQVNVQVNTWEK